MTDPMPNTTLPLIEIEELVETLRSFSHAYPEDIFTPLSDRELEDCALVITRASAGMGRHVAPFMARAADALDALCDAAKRAVELEKDAARWRTLLTLVSGGRDPAGRECYVIEIPDPLPTVSIMKGSVAGHFTSAIDALSPTPERPK